MFILIKSKRRLRLCPPLQGRHGWCKFGLISIKEEVGTVGLCCDPKNSLGSNDSIKTSNAAAHLRKKSTRREETSKC
jgi:hypothetical protein